MAAEFAILISALLLVVTVVALWRSHRLARAADAVGLPARIAEWLLEDGFDLSLSTVLQTVAEALHGDRCTLVLLRHDRRSFDVHQEWRSGGGEPAATGSQGLLVDDCSRLSRPLLDGKPVQLTGSALPGRGSGEQRVLGSPSARALVGAPLLAGDQATGWITVETDTERRWNRQEIDLLCRTGKLLAAAEARQRSEDELRRLAQALEQSPVTVMITDPDGIIEYVNPQFTETTGYSREEAIGKTPRILHSGRNPPKVYVDLWQTITTGRRWRGELINRKKNGELYWGAVSISAIRAADGSMSHYVCIKQDITERKQAEAQLEQARDRANRASQARIDFLATMGREIRTPVNAIVGNAHLAMQTEAGDKHREYLGKIRASSRTLLALINDLLDLTELEAGRMVLDAVAFKLDDVLDSVIELLRTKAEQKGLTLTISRDQGVPGSLIGDPLRLEQALVILGGNAVKFTERGEVAVACRLVGDEDDLVRLAFSVKDTGIGIGSERLSGIFEPVPRDGAITAGSGSTGLGLAIARRLVELMGGDIEVSSEEGIGSEFTFTVQLRLRVQEGAVQRLASPGDLRGMRVLVADDSHSDRRVLCEALESFSFTTFDVDSGRAALQQLERAEADGDAFEVVLLDWKMPSPDGLETARRIKRHPGLKHKPVVILITGHGREDVIAQADQGLLDGFLLKPISHSLLFDAIMTALGRQEEVEPGPALPAAEPSPMLPAARVLVVEDNPINQEVAEELLTGMGVEVVIASNGQEAIDTLGRELFDLIVMDIQMPVLDGYQTTALIRDDPGLGNIPIVAMTAHAMSGDREKCLAAGMDDYLSKPIDAERLYEVLSRWIDRQGMQPAPAPPAEAVGEEEEPMEEIRGIDTEAGLKRLSGNRTLYRKLLFDFLHDYRGIIETIKTALDLGHTDIVLRQVHTIKGIAATIGAHTVHFAARDLEAAISKGEIEHFATLRNQLEKALAPVLDALATLEKESSGAYPAVVAEHPATIDAELLEPLMTEALRLLELGDPEVTDQLDRMAEQLAGSRAGRQLDALRNQVDNFDFEDAVVTLCNLARDLGVELEGAP